MEITYTENGVDITYGGYRIAFGCAYVYVVLQDGDEIEFLTLADAQNYIDWLNDGHSVSDPWDSFIAWAQAKE